jgi:hypothetical protein
MKIPIAAIVVVVLAWLGLWGSNTGILVYSEGMAVMRDCRYFIGVSVVKRLTPLADRCPVIRQVGA